MSARHWRWLPAALLLCAAATAAEVRQLEGIAIIGNEELPKSLFIVPWKPAELNAGLPTPVSGLPSEAPAPLDPAVFRRELANYETLRQMPSD